MTAVLPGLAARLRNRRGVLVDSNVLLDVASADAKWGSWSASALAACAELANLIINPIIYAEVSIGYKSIEKLNGAFPAELYQREALPWEAGFLAGRCFVAYRRRGGRRGGLRAAPLPDFYIGAHAAIESLAVLTRDAARYRTYFPTLEVLSP